MVVHVDIITSLHNKLLMSDWILQKCLQVRYEMVAIP